MFIFLMKSSIVLHVCHSVEFLWGGGGDPVSGICKMEGVYARWRMLRGVPWAKRKHFLLQKI